LQQNLARPKASLVKGLSKTFCFFQPFIFVEVAFNNGLNNCLLKPCKDILIVSGGQRPLKDLFKFNDV